MTSPRVLGRYVLHDEIAAGGMAVVHLARMVGPVGFSRTVAIKRLHNHLAREPEFVSMFLDEARLAARIQHPNVVPTLDVVALESELFIVMEYVQGESLAGLIRAIRAEGGRIPVPILAAIVSGALYGLHAAHTARGERGEALNIVHRDVSPQNILVGVDGSPRLLDFGVAKAIGRIQTTRDGQIKGKTSYMAPEQLRGKAVDARTDVYAAAVVLWEGLTGQRLFTGASAEETMMAILERKVPKPSSLREEVSAALDEVVLTGLARNPDERFATARDMAIALEKATHLASGREVGEWVHALIGDDIARRASRIREIESEATIPETELVVALPAGEETSVEVPAAPGRRSRAGVALAVTLAVLVAGGAGVVLLPRAAHNHAVETSSASSPPPPPAVTSAPAPEPPSPVSSAARPEVSAPAPPPATAPRTTPAIHPQKHKPSCDPPYTVDANGFRNPKPECF